MMLKRLPTNDSPIRIILQQRRQQIRGIIAPQRLHRHEVGDRPLRPLGKFRIVMRQPVHPVPIGIRIGRPPPLEDFDELIDVGSAGEEGQAGGHFGEDASDRPDVDGGGVAGCAEEEFGGAVPEGDDLVGVGSVGEAGEAGEAEIGEFEGQSVGADQEIMRLQIPMQHPMSMTIPHPIQNLPHKTPHHTLRQPHPLPYIIAPLPLIHKRF